jgi:hypothetical protein
MRAALAIALLALFAAPVVRAVPDAATKRSCCPEERAPKPEPAAPCQQLAATTCCHELAVPAGSTALSAPAVWLPVPANHPISRGPAIARARTALEREAPPPLSPLAASCVLLV